MRRVAPWPLVAGFAVGAAVALALWLFRSEERPPPRPWRPGTGEPGTGPGAIPRPRLLPAAQPRPRRERTTGSETPSTAPGPSAPSAALRPVTGKVVSDAGDPVAGALVTLDAEPKPDETLPSARTDVLGKFLLEVPEDPTPTLVASARGFARSTPVGAVATDQELLLRLQPGFALDVLVVDSEGSPVAGAWVVSEERKPAYPQVAGTTDAEGRVHFDDLPHVRRAVGVAARGFARASREGVLFGGPEQRFVLEPERGLRLRVTAADGSIVRPEVQVLDAGLAHVWHELRETADGLEVLGLGGGPYRLVLSDEAFTQKVLEGVRGGDDPIDVRMEPGLAIEGRLPIDDAGEYVYAVRRGAEPRGPERHPLRRAVRPAWVEVGARTFRIPGLEPGPYDLVVVVGRDGEDAAAVPGDVGGVVVLDVAAGTHDLEVHLPTGGTIEGSVVDGRGPHGEVMEVQAYDERGLCRALAEPTSPGATFRLRGLPAGRYRVVAWFADGTSSETEAEAPSTGLVLR